MAKFQLVFVFCVFSFLSSCSQRTAEPIIPKKINAVSFVASRDTVTQQHLDPVLNIHANMVAIMPFGFLRNMEEPEIRHNSDRQWFGETAAGAAQYIDLIHNNSLKVMMKPQIWIRHGEFTGYLKMSTEADWLTLEEEYREFIMTYVKVAEENKVDMFCIGTELEQFIMNRPNFWHSLIGEIRKVYSGKLTYAANWDEYKRVPFWKELDYIGVDAYFPISDRKTPTIEEARKGWLKWKEELQGVATSVDKKIIFTEYGYRSLDYAGKEPWVSDHTLTTVNLESQANLTQALFEEVYSEDWFAGGFIWKWFINHDRVGGKEDAQFTPQNKPVEAVIKQHFKSLE